MQDSIHEIYKETRTGKLIEQGLIVVPTLN